jgi:GAF domain-containing protein
VIGTPSTSSTALPLTDELAAVFARMTGLLLSTETVAAALGLLSSLAQETVPGSTGAGISLIDDHRRSSSGSTDERVRQADDLQYELDEGPCLTAAADRHLVRIDDLTSDGRWPRWSQAAAQLGLRAAMSAPIVAADTSLGAIKVYAERPGTFDARSEQLLSMFSAQAALLVANARTREQAQRLSDDMRRAIQGRDTINVAKGVLMERHGVTEDAAFGILLARSAPDGATLAQAAGSIVGSAVHRGR